MDIIAEDMAAGEEDVATEEIVGVAVTGDREDPNPSPLNPHTQLMWEICQMESSKEI